MKSLKLWQKAGLVVAIVGGLTLGGLTPKYDSKGLESKIPSIGMSTAEAKEVNPQGYEIPDLTGYTKIKEGYLDLDRTKDGVKETFIEIFKGPDNFIMKYTSNGKTWAWGKLKSSSDPQRYAIIDSDCNGVFDEKYLGDEGFHMPECLE